MSRYRRDNNRGRNRAGRESGYFRNRRDPERDENTGEIIRNRESSSDGGDRSSSYGRDRSSSDGGDRSSSYGRDRRSSDGGDRSSSYGRDRNSSYGRDRRSSNSRGRNFSRDRGDRRTFSRGDRESYNSDKQINNRREFDQINNKTDLDIRLNADNTKQLEKICKENNWTITEGINNAIELLTLSDPNSKKKTSLGSAIRTQFIKHIIKDMVNTIEDKLTSGKQITEQEKNYPEFEELGQEITDKLFKLDTDKNETSKDDKEETSKDDKVLTKKVSRKKVEKKEQIDVKKVKKEEKWIGPKMPKKVITRKT